MTEELDPASAAESKAIQFLQIAVMAAEAVAVLAAARAETRAARTEADTAGLLSSIEATQAAAVPLWQPALDAAQRGQLNEQQALNAWSTAQPWHEVDPVATEASRASLERLRELQPAAVDAYDTLRAKGVAPTSAMQSVVPLLAGEPGSSTDSTLRGSVIHSAADAVAASYPAPLTATAAQAATQLDVVGAAGPRQLATAVRPHVARFGR